MVYETEIPVKTKSVLALLSVRMRLVVDVHELADGGMSIFLRGGKRLMPEQLLNGAQVGAIGQQVRGEGVPHRMRVQIPVHVYQAHVFFDDAADGALRKAPAGVI